MPSAGPIPATHTQRRASSLFASRSASSVKFRGALECPNRAASSSDGFQGLPENRDMSQRCKKDRMCTVFPTKPQTESLEHLLPAERKEKSFKMVKLYRRER